MIISALIIGLVTGTLIGLTGMGGGALLMPAIIIFLGLSPTLAVGTSLVASGLSKVFASILHFRAGNVDLKLVFSLLIGSVPGSFIGATLLEALKVRIPERVDAITITLTGILLIVIPLITLIRFLLGLFYHEQFHSLLRLRNPSPTIVATIGFVGGFLVGFTSVGSGTIIVTLLILIFSLPASRLVGTDIMHGMIITLFAGIVHLFFANVDLTVTLLLLAGLLPGTILGVRLCSLLPGRLIKGILTVFLILVGVWMLTGLG